MALPRVHEAARANSWRRQGCLREFYGGRELTPLLKDCIDVIEGNQRQAENYNIRNPPKRE